jgi:hypothetical protein
MEQKGFFESLFDLSFSSLITTRIIKVIYILGMVVVGIAVIGMIVAGFSESVGGGIALLIFSPLIALLYIIFLRVWLELIMVMFKINDNVEIIAKEKKEPTSSQ